MGMDLRGSTLLSSGSFAPKFLEMIKQNFNAFWCKKMKFGQNALTWFMIWTTAGDSERTFSVFGSSCFTGI